MREKWQTSHIGFVIHTHSMFEICAVFLLATFVSAILYFERQKWSTKRELKGFPQPKHAPILGVASRFVGKSNEELLEIFNELFSEVPRTPLQSWFGYKLVIISNRRG